jgi:hypothetical protein
MFVVRDLNQAVKPATMMTTKVTIQNMAYAELLAALSRPPWATRSWIALPRTFYRATKPTSCA